MAFWSCKHNWRVENKDVLPSAWEQMGKDERPAPDSLAPWMFVKTVSTTYVCTHCGKTMTETTTGEVESYA